MSQTKTFSLNLETMIVLAGIVIVGLGYGLYYYWDLSEKQGEEIAELKSDLQDTQGNLVDANVKISSLRGEKTNLQQENQQKSAESEANYYLLTFTAEKLNELESILLEYDADSTEVIEFYSNNCYLYEPELTQANLYFGAWQAAATGYAKRYQKILDDINNLVSGL